MQYTEYIGKLIWTDRTEERIERINHRIKDNGVSLQIVKEKNGDAVLTIEYRKKMKNERNAGRKRMDTAGTSTALWKVSDVKNSMKEIGYQETAKLLGCSKSTLYRRLKELKEKDDWLFY